MTMSVVVTWDSQQTVYYSPDVLAWANKVPVMTMSAFAVDSSAVSPSPVTVSASEDVDQNRDRVELEETLRCF